MDCNSSTILMSENNYGTLLTGHISLKAISLQSPNEVLFGCILYLIIDVRREGHGCRLQRNYQFMLFALDSCWSFSAWELRLLVCARKRIRNRYSAAEHTTCRKLVGVLHV